LLGQFNASAAPRRQHGKLRLGAIVPGIAATETMMSYGGGLDRGASSSAANKPNMLKMMRELFHTNNNSKTQSHNVHESECPVIMMMSSLTQIPCQFVTQ
jgi:hypothetical protein